MSRLCRSSCLGNSGKPALSPVCCKSVMFWLFSTPCQQQNKNFSLDEGLEASMYQRCVKTGSCPSWHALPPTQPASIIEFRCRFTKITCRCESAAIAGDCQWNYVDTRPALKRAASVLSTMQRCLQAIAVLISLRVMAGCVYKHMLQVDLKLLHMQLDSSCTCELFL